MSNHEQLPDEAEPAYDPHRFTAEPKRKSNKIFAVAITIFVVIVLAIAGSVALAKARLSDYFSERQAKATADKIKDAEEDTRRKSKVFEKPEVTTHAALPGSFGDNKTLPPLSGLLPPPEGKGAPALADTMMLPDGPNDSAAERMHVKLPELPLPPPSPLKPPGKTRARTVQEFAADIAAQAPITGTQQATAADLGNRSYLLARGAYIPCVLETQLMSSIEGSSSCVVPQNIYSDDGKVVLIERGSKIFGSYKSQIGGDRIAVLWERVKTPTGVVLDVNSPAADGVGTIGAHGVVDNRWTERIGAAVLLSLVEDLMTIETGKFSHPNQGQVINTTTAPIPSATTGQVSSISREVLKETLNIKPTLYKNRGDRLMVYVNRDLWFDSVYQLTQR